MESLDNINISKQNLEEKISKPSEEIKKSSEKETFYQILTNSFKLFYKVYGIRILFSLFKFLRSKAYKNFSLIKFLSYIFNFSNLRTSLFVSLLPLLYKTIKILLERNFPWKETWLVFVSALISSFISVTFEEKTKLVNYIVLTIFVRAIHTVCVVILKELNILQNTGKVYDFCVFLFSAILAWSVYFLNPRFKPITELFDKYANYTHRHELESAISFRDATRLVD